jgi:hypothetical protein
VLYYTFSVGQWAWMRMDVADKHGMHMGVMRWGECHHWRFFFFCLSFFALVRPRPPFLPIRYALARLTEEMEDARWLKGVGGCMQGISDPGFYVRKVQAQDQ